MPSLTAGAPGCDVDIPLRDGRTVQVRPAIPADEQALLGLFSRLDADDRALRFFTAGADLGAMARQAARGGDERLDLVAVGADEDRVLGHACAVRGRPEEAEVAFAVDPGLRGEGVATSMLALLAGAARAAGILRLTAVVLPENRRMLEVFRESGLEPVVRAGAGEVHLVMPSELGPEALARYDARRAEAAAAAVGHVLRPASVAVIGATDRPGSVGAAVMANLVSGGFTGRLVPVSRRGGAVAGLPAARSLDELDEGVDLAVIAIPADGVPDVAAACARRGVRALVVLSDGFAEAGPEGRARQAELVALCRRAGMRLVGPNCLGVISTAPDVRLNASFAPHPPPPGRMAFLSQSGALGIAVIDEVRRLRLGLSAFVSVGDKADLSGNDFLSYWAADDGTDVILLYLESFGNPRRFARVARAVARRKPIVAVKGGRSAAGARAAGSHTGALLSGSQAAVDALFAQAGVIATETLGELFDVAALVAAQPVPRGGRVGIVTNGGGLGILCADACSAAGLEVPELDPATARAVADAGPAKAAVGNPVDLLAEARPEHFRRTIARLGAGGAVDAIAALYVPPMVSDPRAVAEAIRDGAAEADVPVAAVLAMADPPLDVLGGGGGSVPVYRFPEEAARAIAHAARYGRWLERPDEPPAPVAADRDAAAATIAAALRRGPGWLEPAEVAELLDAYGIARPRQHEVRGAPAAGRAARELGGPVALKAIAPGLVHRTDAGAVAVGLATPTAVVREARRMRRHLVARGIEAEGFVVQEMASPGVEVLVGVVADPTFGPVVACAAGGTAAELLHDVAVRLAPLTRRDAGEMVRSLRTFPLLDGFRGAPRRDVGALEDLLVRLAALADAHGEIAELECNPVVVGADGALAVDARVRLQELTPALPEPALTPPGHSR